jgi:hypothetical protein
MTLHLSLLDECKQGVDHSCCRLGCSREHIQFRGQAEVWKRIQAAHGELRLGRFVHAVMTSDHWQQCRPRETTLQWNCTQIHTCEFGSNVIEGLMNIVFSCIRSWSRRGPIINQWLLLHHHIIAGQQVILLPRHKKQAGNNRWLPSYSQFVSASSLSSSTSSFPMAVSCRCCAADTSITMVYLDAVEACCPHHRTLVNSLHRFLTCQTSTHPRIR